MAPMMDIAHGARAAEEALFRRLEGLLPASPADLGVLGVPVRVVVPSASLRQHLLATLVRRRGRAVAGLVCQTHFGLALEVLQRAGEPAMPAGAIVDVLIRRFARRHRPLREALGGLVDGYGVVAATVRDFLDAGFEPVHAEALDELLASDGRHAAAPAAVRRARAVVAVTAAFQESLDDLGLSHRVDLLRRAQSILERDGLAALPTRALLVHGFADATGVVTDWIEALLRATDGVLVLDHPPRVDGEEAASHSAASHSAAPHETAFTARFAGRLGQLATPNEVADGPPSPTNISWLPAAGPEAEARGVARAVGELIAAGTRPEGIGIVARDVAPFALPLRRQLAIFGVPFSAPGALGPLLPAGRDLAGLAELVRHGPRLPVERWLDLLHRSPEVEGDPDTGRRRLAPERRTELRLALFARGACRLADLPPIVDPPLLDQHSQYSLPWQTAAPPAPKSPTRRRPSARWRKVDTTLLRWAQAAAGALNEELERWQSAASLGVDRHLETLLRIANHHLGWPATLPARRLLGERLTSLGRALRGAPRLSHAELVDLLTATLGKLGRDPLGGAGGGVQVVSALEARGRTFDHLFVMGLNRDTFPRPIHEDPLLPDPLRALLAKLLPDLPIKAAGFDEERYLFAQLCTASPQLTLSWQTVGEDGARRVVSPLMEALVPVELAADDAIEAPAAVDEHLLYGALHGGRPRFASLLPLALAAARQQMRAATVLDPAPLAQARLAVLNELDPDLRTVEGRRRRRQLGPYFGFIGPCPTHNPGADDEPNRDPRRRALAISTLEGLAACPWQTFVERLLRVRPVPDPLASLPGLEAVLVGNLVHRVLERVVVEAIGGGSGASLDAGPPRPVPWPSASRLETYLETEAEALMEDEGLALPGLGRAAAERARLFLDTVARLDWADGPLTVVGAERAYLVQVSDRKGKKRSLRFRADRVDQHGGDQHGGDQQGGQGLRFTDYKTGKPFATDRKPETRQQKFLQAVQRGERLQAVAYLRASPGPAEGRFLFLGPEVEDDARVFAVGSQADDFRRAFDGVMGHLFALWDAGSFFPRLVLPDRDLEPDRCRYCDVAEGCLRRDSGARRRLRSWALREEMAGRTDPARLPAPEEALRGVWELARR